MQITTNRFSFVSASLALMVTYVTSAVPIPLYGTYQLHDHVSYWQLSLSSVVYFIGAVTALVLLGRLSNHWDENLWLCSHSCSPLYRSQCL